MTPRQVLWRARCIERCTPGSGSGPEKRNSRKAVTALRADFHQTADPPHLPRSLQSQQMAVQLGVAHTANPAADRPSSPNRTHATPGSAHFFIASMRISARSSSSSAPTSPTPPSCASTATNAPNAKPPRPASGSKRSTTDSPRSTTRTEVQVICDSPGTELIDALLRKWLRILPHPFTDEDQAAGYRYELSILQAESRSPRCSTRRCRGGSFRASHPRQPRHRPPRPRRADLRPPHHAPQTSSDTGRFRTRVITDGVVPSLHVDYKNAKIKQYYNCDARSHAMSDYADWRVSRC